HTVPGIGKLLSLVLLYDMHDIDRFPTVQDVVSSGRLVQCAKASAGTRVGASGKKNGNAPRTWALSQAAGVCLRDQPRRHKYLARLEKTLAKGKALTRLAHQLARAVSDMRKRHTACAMYPCLQSEGSRVGEPDASLDTQGMSLERAYVTSCGTASLHAKVR